MRREQHGAVLLPPFPPAPSPPPQLWTDLLLSSSPYQTKSGVWFTQLSQLLMPIKKLSGMKNRGGMKKWQKCEWKNRVGRVHCVQGEKFWASQPGVGRRSPERQTHVPASRGRCAAAGPASQPPAARAVRAPPGGRDLAAGQTRPVQPRGREVPVQSTAPHCTVLRSTARHCTSMQGTA